MMIVEPKDNAIMNAQEGLKSTSFGKKNPPARCQGTSLRGRQKGLEPSTFGTTIRRSNQLSYCLRDGSAK